MHDDEDDHILNRTDCVPTLLAVSNPLDEGHAPGIVKNELRRFKVDTVLRLVGLVLRPIPFDPHLYLQYSTYSR